MLKSISLLGLGSTILDMYVDYDKAGKELKKSLDAFLCDFASEKRKLPFTAPGIDNFGYNSPVLPTAFSSEERKFVGSLVAEVERLAREQPPMNLAAICKSWCKDGKQFTKREDCKWQYGMLQTLQVQMDKAEEVVKTLAQSDPIAKRKLVVEECFAQLCDDVRAVFDAKNTNPAARDNPATKEVLKKSINNANKKMKKKRTNSQHLCHG